MVKDNNRIKRTEINGKTPLMIIALPMFLEMLLGIMLNNVDTLMLSHYSETSVGAVGNANQIMMLLIITFNIIATATSVVVAQYLGAKKYDSMNLIYTLSLVVNLAFGIILSLGLVCFKNQFLALIHVPEHMRHDAKTYINIVGSALFLQAGYNVMLQILRCNGKTKVGMYVSIVMNIINIVGNYIFLYGPLKSLDMGVAGVGISTVASRVLALTIALVFFYKEKIGKISHKYLKPFPKQMLIKMIKIGLPSGGENFSYSMYQLVLLSFINTLGDDAVTARSYCTTLISLAMVFSNSCAMATQIIVGHLVGAKDNDTAYKRVYKTLKLTLPITITLATVNAFLSPLTLQLFTSNKEVIRFGFYIMLVDIVIETGRCLNVTFVGSLKASGDYMYPLIVGLITMWTLGATVGYIAGIALGFGVAGVYAGTASDEFFRGLITMRRWRSKKWIGKSVVNDEK